MGISSVNSEARENFEFHAKKLAEMKAAPTGSDIEAYFRAAATLPDIDFGPSFEKEKTLNTPRYQRIVAEAERLLTKGKT